MSKKPFTYISLFSCAGVGCYGFKQAGFECVATNELSPRRLVIQKYNHKCSRDEGYICGDIPSIAQNNKFLTRLPGGKKTDMSLKSML